MKQIQLTKGLVALVDDDDFDRVNKYKWTASHESRGTKYYAIRRIKDPSGRKVPRWNEKKSKYVYASATIKIRMHRFILGLPPGVLGGTTVVDHINHDSLDNRKANLEIVTQEENMRRSQGWKRKISMDDICL